MNKQALKLSWIYAAIVVTTLAIGILTERYAQGALYHLVLLWSWLFLVALTSILLVSLFMPKGNNSDKPLTVASVCLVAIFVTIADTTLEMYGWPRVAGSGFSAGNGILFDGLGVFFYVPINAALLLIGLAACAANSFMKLKKVTNR